MVLELQVNVAGPFPRTGGEGVAANPEVVGAAYSDLVLLQGSVSDPVNLDENRLVMIKLREHLPVAVKPLDEVRADVIATLSENKARDAANEKAGEMLAALQSGTSDLESLATESELEYGLHETVKRNAFVPDAKLVQEVFKLKKPAEGETITAVLPTDLGFAVVELNAVVAGELDTEQPFAKQQYERVVANSYASQEATALMQQLRESADIEVYEDRIQ